MHSLCIKERYLKFTYDVYKNGIDDSTPIRIGTTTDFEEVNVINYPELRYVTVTDNETLREVGRLSSKADIDDWALGISTN